MQFHLEQLVGKKFEFGFQDCYTTIRDFYTLNYGFTLPNYARPTNWWDAGMDMYIERYHKNGFKVLDCHPTEYTTGDLVLMAIQSTVANHAGIMLPNGEILHHLYGRVSIVEPYRGLTRNSTIAVLRNPALTMPKDTETVEILDIMPISLRRRAEHVFQTY